MSRRGAKRKPYSIENDAFDRLSRDRAAVPMNSELPSRIGILAKRILLEWSDAYINVSGDRLEITANGDSWVIDLFKGCYYLKRRITGTAHPSMRLGGGKITSIAWLEEWFGPRRQVENYQQKLSGLMSQPPEEKKKRDKPANIRIVTRVSQSDRMPKTYGELEQRVLSTWPTATVKIFGPFHLRVGIRESETDVYLTKRGETRTAPYGGGKTTTVTKWSEFCERVFPAHALSG